MHFTFMNRFLVSDLLFIKNIKYNIIGIQFSSIAQYILVYNKFKITRLYNAKLKTMLVYIGTYIITVMLIS